MRVLVDTNVVLDVLLARSPFVLQAVEVFRLVEQSRIEGYLCATTVTTVDYLLTRSLPRPKARASLTSLLGLFEVAPINRPVLEAALKSRVMDFEDAVMEQAGILAGVDALVTRNLKDFRRAAVKTVDPKEFLAHFEV